MLSGSKKLTGLVSKVIFFCTGYFFIIFIVSYLIDLRNTIEVTTSIEKSFFSLNCSRLAKVFSFRLGVVIDVEEA